MVKYFISLLSATAMLVAITLSGCSKNDDSDNNGSSGGSSTGQETEEKFYVKGADLSWITEMENKGYSFYDDSGQSVECTELLCSLGFNTVRECVLVSPANGYCGVEDVLVKCRRAKNLGMKLMLDFHFSDSYAGSQKQDVPLSWKIFTIDDLVKYVSEHVSEVLYRLHNEHINIDWIQIGNEVTNGMLWETCRIKGNDADNFIKCFKAGADAARAVYPEAEIILHVDNACDWDTLNQFYGLISSYSLEYDLVGLSLYPSRWDDSIKAYPDWKANTDLALKNFYNLFTTYGKESILVEFGMPASEPEKSKAALQYLMDNTKNMDYFRGICMWEPESEKSRNDYDYGAFSDGKPTSALDPFKN